MPPTTAERLYAWLVADAAEGHDQLDEATAAALPVNAARQVGALLLTKAGDRIVDPKTVLAWLLAALGAPAAMLGLLVPIRESGSMLPQAALVPLITRIRQRKRVWLAGAAGQAVAVVAMAVVAFTATGVLAGVLVLAALAVFALSRSLSSIATKDVLGRTVPQGQRGRITGWSDTGSGAIAIATGLGLAALGASRATGQEVGAGAFGWLLLAAAAVWLAAAAVYAGIREPREVDDSPDPRPDPDADDAVPTLALLRDDPPFRRFVIARTLLLVSALTPPYVVAIATDRGGSAIGALGPFVVASGLAALLGGRIWGGFADRSSRKVLIVASAAASAVVLGYVGLLQVGGLAEASWLHPLTYFLLALVHTGTRVGRSTYVVDLGGGDRRTAYVAVSNTAMGVLLLVVGAATAAISTAGPVAALLALAALGVLGVPVARSLPEV